MVISINYFPWPTYIQESLMLCTLNSKFILPYVLATDIIFSTCGFCRVLLYTHFQFISIASVLKITEYFYTHKQKALKQRCCESSPRRVLPAGAWLDWKLGSRRTKVSLHEAVYCIVVDCSVRALVQRAMYPLNDQILWLIAPVWAQTHWMIMLIMN